MYPANKTSGNQNHQDQVYLERQAWTACRELQHFRNLGSFFNSLKYIQIPKRPLEYFKFFAATTDCLDATRHNKDDKPDLSEVRRCEEIRSQLFDLIEDLKPRTNLEDVPNLI